MYRTLIKSNRMNMQDQEAVVIDANALIAKKLEAIANSYMQSAEPEAMLDDSMLDPDAERLAALLDDPGSVEEGGFSEGIPGSNVIKAEPVYQGPTPEELVEQAKKEIEQLKQAAVRDIEQAKREAIETGKREGYDAGYRQGMQETEQMKKECETRAAALEAQYDQMIKELEPRFVETLTGVYEHVLNVSLADETQLIMFLAGNALRNIEGGKQFLVHVSKEDYPIVSMQKKQLFASVGANVTLEVISDATLSKNDCMIETEGGIFDCGLGTQLQELTKQLKLLSYTEDAGQ